LGILTTMGNLSLSSGTLFANRFEIERAAGSGGMGTVYRARDRYSSEVVALKLLHPEDGGQDDALLVWAAGTAVGEVAKWRIAQCRFCNDEPERLRLPRSIPCRGCGLTISARFCSILASRGRGVPRGRCSWGQRGPEARSAVGP
jgi:hypothetical protein